MRSEPARGSGVSANWGRDLVREVRRNRVTAGDGLRETQTDNGKIISIASTRPPIMAAEGDLLPWTAEIFFDESDAWMVRFRRCGYVRGPITNIFADGDVIGDSRALTLVAAEGEDSGGVYWISVEINTITGAIDRLISTQEEAEAFDRVKPVDNEGVFKKLLYTFEYTAPVAAIGTEGEEGYVPAVKDSWSIKDGWYRLMPELGAYV